MPERFFSQTDVPLLLQQSSSGLYVTSDHLQWMPVNEQDLEASALSARAETPTKSIVMTKGGIKAHDAGLAVAFGDHLSAVRNSRDDVDPRCIVSVTQPRLPTGSVRIPHLLTYRRSRSMQDSIIWELLPHTSAQCWLGNELPDQAYVETHLAEIIRLRQVVRDEILPIGQPYNELQRRLAAGRYLSMLFVYQNIELIQEILTIEPKTA